MVQLFLSLNLFLLMTFIPVQKKKHVIFFGDSITELGVKPGGFIQRIDSMSKQEGQGGRFGFSGSGISGNKVYDLYLRMEEDVLSRKPNLVIIYIGVNDVWHKSLAGTGTDADKFERFYEAIIKKLTANKIKMILCTPAVIGEKNDHTNPQDADLDKYSQIIGEIARKNALPLVDLRKIFGEYIGRNNPENKPKGILTSDGVHLNARGNKLVAEEMWKLIKRGV